VIKHSRLAVAVLAALALSACGGGDSAGSTANSSADPLHPAASAAKRAGCPNPVKQTNTPLLTQDAVDCRDPDPKWKASDGSYVSFYTFGNNQGRDAWLQTAATSGHTRLIKADKLVVEIPDDLANLDAVASQLAQAVGGERVS
jgi:hypothetical protein